MRSPLVDAASIVAGCCWLRKRCARCDRARRVVTIALLAALVTLQSGCVQRRMTIRSNPPGALVYVDGYEIGTTPVSVNFIYYGKRNIRLVKDGYETLSVDQRFWPPWYQVFPIDFVTENLLPWEMRDERALAYQLVPQRIEPADQVLARAEQLRRARQAEVAGIAPVAWWSDGLLGTGPATGGVPPLVPGFADPHQPTSPYAPLPYQVPGYGVPPAGSPVGPTAPLPAPVEVLPPYPQQPIRGPQFPGTVPQVQPQPLPPLPAYPSPSHVLPPPASQPSPGNMPW